MKTSNKLVIAAIILILVSLVGYDYLLKGAYVSGKYKDPYNTFISLKFKEFDTVDLVSSTAVNVKFVQGPFSVRIDSNFSEYTRIKQTGKRLHISAVFEANYMSDPNPYTMVISCPHLSVINIDATYKSNGKQVTDTTVRDDWRMRKVLIDGFKQDSLIINQDYGSTVVLANSRLQSISTTTGKSVKSGSKLVILEHNQIQKTNLDILNSSTLILGNAQIGDLNYRLADSAKLILNGKASNLLKNSKSQQK
ncbi:MAG TPA: hypothetical protein VNX40_09050 [Mucilaginibacter sp.]|jgi:hypothetical protein|nr:hypothetical protein [Mucilaginibacter sp.]